MLSCRLRASGYCVTGGGLAVRTPIELESSVTVGGGLLFELDSSLAGLLLKRREELTFGGRSESLNRGLTVPSAARGEEVSRLWGPFLSVILVRPQGTICVAVVPGDSSSTAHSSGQQHGTSRAPNERPSSQYRNY